METENQLKSLISETYQRTLDLAKNITKNRFQFFDEEITVEHLLFLKKISKSFRDYKILTKKNTRKKTENNSEKLRIFQQSSSPSSNRQDKLNKGRVKLDNLIEQSYRLAKETKSGKSGFRNLTPSPPPVIKKIRNKSIFSESSDSDEKTSTYVNLLNGKTEEIELPSFKEYLRECKGNGENQKMFKKIENCQKELGNFEKRINGLETFCKLNPGVPWNNDKALLMKLSGGQYNKSALIKAYNEKVSSVGPSHRNSMLHKMGSLSQKKQASVNTPKIEERRNTSKPRLRKKNVSEQKNYLEEIQQAKEDLHEKTIKIFNKIQAERPNLMLSKASLIFGEKERYKGKIHLFEQMNSYKRIIENGKLSKLTTCKTQVKLYKTLLEYLKDYKGMPSPAMISFVEAVKELIEGGWALNGSNLNEVIKAFDSEELIDLKDLIRIVEEFLKEKN